MSSSIIHANFGWLHAPPFPPASCHCLILKGPSSVALVDTGIGLADIKSPVDRIGSEAIDGAGFQFDPAMTAHSQLEAMGLGASSVTDILLTHADPDHAGGLADFPNARVHLSSEELGNLEAGNARYGKQFEHGPHWVTYADNNADWCGLAARRVSLEGFGEIFLVPLFGHTRGHCGVAIEADGGWMLHVGDAYYLRDELTIKDHPVDGLAQMRADDDTARRESLETLRRLLVENTKGIEYTGYHDTGELPESVPGYPTEHLSGT